MRKCLLPKELLKVRGEIKLNSREQLYEWIYINGCFSVALSQNQKIFEPALKNMSFFCK